MEIALAIVTSELFFHALLVAIGLGLMALAAKILRQLQALNELIAAWEVSSYLQRVMGAV